MKKEQELHQSPLIKAYLMDVDAKSQPWKIESIYSQYGIEFKHFERSETYPILRGQLNTSAESFKRYQLKKNNITIETLIRQFNDEKPAIEFHTYVGKQYLTQFSTEELDNLLSYTAKPILIPRSLLPDADKNENYFLDTIYILNHEKQVQFFIQLFMLNSTDEAFSEALGNNLAKDFLERCSENVIDSLVVECFKIKNLNLLTTLLLSPKADKYLLIDTYNSIYVRKTCMNASLLKSVNERERLQKLHTPVGLLSYAILKWKEAFPVLLNMTNPTGEEALYQGEIRKSQYLYKSKPTLHYAVMEGNIEAVTELLNAGVYVNAPDTEGRTALHWAVIQNNPVITEQLLNRGADVAAADQCKRTPLHFAAIHNNAEITHSLLKAIPELNAVDIFKCTPLHIAAFYNSDVVIGILQEKEANHHLLCNKPTFNDLKLVENNSTPFWIALLCGYKEAVNELSKTEDFKLYTSLELKILLKYAMRSGLVDFINHLIQENPELENCLGIFNCFSNINTSGKGGVLNTELFREFNSYNHRPDYEELKNRGESEPYIEIKAKIQRLYNQTVEVLIGKIKLEILKQPQKNLGETNRFSTSYFNINALEDLIKLLKKNQSWPLIDTIDHWETYTFSATHSLNNRFLTQKMIQEPGLKAFIQELKNSVRIIPEPQKQHEAYQREEYQADKLDEDKLHCFSSRLF